MIPSLASFVLAKRDKIKTEPPIILVPTTTTLPPFWLCVRERDPEAKKPPFRLICSTYSDEHKQFRAHLDYVTQPCDVGHMTI